MNFKLRTGFKFWCQRVLPTVYDDSLSYYELLCKLVNYINDMSEDIVSLEEFVQDLGIPEAVAEKMDQYLQDGTLATLIDEYLDIFVRPEMYGAVGDGATDDSTAFQEAVDAVKAAGGTILLTGSYLLDDDIVIDRSSEIDNPVAFLGANRADIKFTSTHGFIGSANDQGNVTFANVHFHDSERILICNRSIIRVRFDNCSFSKITKICDCYDVTQSVYFMGCIIRKCEHVFYQASSAARGYDLRIDACLIEHGGDVVNFPTYTSPNGGSMTGCTFTNSCIEGMEGTIFDFSTVRTVNITDNYFEENRGYIRCSEYRMQNLNVMRNSVVTKSTSPVRYLVELPSQVPDQYPIKIMDNSVADITYENFYPNTNIPASHAGLYIDRNNTVNGTDPTPDTITSQASRPFEATIPASAFESVTEAFSALAKYAYDNGHYNAQFYAVLEGLMNVYGIVNVNPVAHRVSVYATSGPRTYTATYSTYTWSGSLYRYDGVLQD